MVTEITEIVLTLLLIIVTKFLIPFFNAKREEAKARIDNELANKYIDMIYNTVSNCVMATSQTYVDSLKKQNLFDKAAQEKALQNTLTAVKQMLSEDAIKYIHSISSDTDFYLINLIEAKVKEQKQAGT